MALSDHLTLLPVALFLVVLYMAWCRDRREAPLALALGWVAMANLLVMGLTELALHFPRGSGWRRLLCLVGDPLFCSEFAVYWLVARRYRRGAWVWRRWSVAAVIWLGAANGVAHFTTNTVRNVALHGTCLLAIVAASYEQVRLLQTREVAPAHAVLGLCIAVCLLQLLVAFTPGSWIAELYQPAVLLAQMVILLLYLVRLLLPAREGAANSRHRA